MKFANLIVALLSLVFISCAIAEKTAREPTSIDAVTDEFISSVSTSWESYSVCEYRDRTEQHSYIKQLFPKTVLPQRSAIKARHLVVQRQADSSGLDLSIYQIQFAANEEAKRAFSELSERPSGTIPDGKVLTKYAARVEGQRVYVIRTQSIFDPAVISFLKSFTE